MNRSIVKGTSYLINYPYVFCNASLNNFQNKRQKNVIVFIVFFNRDNDDNDDDDDGDDDDEVLYDDKRGY